MMDGTCCRSFSGVVIIPRRCFHFAVLPMELFQRGEEQSVVAVYGAHAHCSNESYCDRPTEGKQATGDASQLVRQ